MGSTLSPILVFEDFSRRLSVLRGAEFTSLDVPAPVPSVRRNLPGEMQG